MIKRLGFMALALIGFALQGAAQTTVKLPKVLKFVKVEEGVNLRKGPSASTPRLIFQSNIDDDCLDCEPSLVFSNKQLRKGDEPARASLLPVLGEEGDWYKVLFCDEGVYSSEAYVMKRFCKDAKERPLTLPPPHDLHFAVVTSGKHANLCLQWLFGWYDERILRLGEYVDGKFIFSRAITFSNSDSYQEPEIMNWGEGDYIEFGSQLFDSYDLNLDKLVKDQKSLDFLMNHQSNMRKVCVVYYGIEDDWQWHTYFIE